ncbi:response regulator transcription factor [Cysteiniphilum sp. JM-1]|uniref:response regulator transcription factor n=1 Tax=Cysteiniphilum sp. JM-1 TaxID=2610891 RepID=UPI0012455C3D|nr:response regulator transcription factor [Cysteiniphilum sp. JM-1]
MTKTLCFYRKKGCFHIKSFLKTYIYNLELTNYMSAIFILDDDQECLDLLKSYFEQFYSVETFSKPELFLQRFAKEVSNCSLLLLDLNLKSNLMGTDVYKSIIMQKKIPTIVISALLDPIDKVICLELGINDYVTKPIHIRELHARIKNLLNLCNENPFNQHENNNAAKGECCKYFFSGCVLDVSKKILVGKSGEVLVLTKTLYNLLVIFLENPKKVVSREILLKRLGKDYDIYDRSIDVQVSGLRKKMTKFIKDEIIQTRHGMGYCFDSDVIKE